MVVVICTEIKVEVFYYTVDLKAWKEVIRDLRTNCNLSKIKLLICDLRIDEAKKRIG